MNESGNPKHLKQFWNFITEKVRIVEKYINNVMLKFTSILYIGFNIIMQCLRFYQWNRHQISIVSMIRLESIECG